MPQSVQKPGRFQDTSSTLEHPSLTWRVNNKDAVAIQMLSPEPRLCKDEKQVRNCLTAVPRMLVAIMLEESRIMTRSLTLRNRRKGRSIHISSPSAKPFMLGASCLAKTHQASRRLRVMILGCLTYPLSCSDTVILVVFFMNSADISWGWKPFFKYL